MQVSAALGGGSISGASVVSPRLFIGRGLQLGTLSGWIEATLGADLFPETRDGTGKFDLTLGLAPRPRLKTYVQLYSTVRPGGIDARIEGSAAYNLFGETWLDLGVSTGLSGARDPQVKIGLWTAF